MTEATQPTPQQATNLTLNPPGSTTAGHQNGRSHTIATEQKTKGTTTKSTMTIAEKRMATKKQKGTRTPLLVLNISMLPGANTSSSPTTHKRPAQAEIREEETSPVQQNQEPSPSEEFQAKAANFVVSVRNRDNDYEALCESSKFLRILLAGPKPPLSEIETVLKSLKMPEDEALYSTICNMIIDTDTEHKQDVLNFMMNFSHPTPFLTDAVRTVAVQEILMCQKNEFIREIEDEETTYLDPPEIQDLVGAAQLASDHFYAMTGTPSPDPLPRNTMARPSVERIKASGFYKEPPTRLLRCTINSSTGPEGNVLPHRTQVVSYKLHTRDVKLPIAEYANRAIIAIAKRSASYGKEFIQSSAHKAQRLFRGMPGPGITLSFPAPLTPADLAEIKGIPTLTTVHIPNSMTQPQVEALFENNEHLMEVVMGDGSIVRARDFEQRYKKCFG